MQDEMKTVKIPVEEYNKIIEARKLLALKGVTNLEQSSGALIANDVKDFEKFTLGIIIGIGATLLIQALSEK